MTKFFNRLQDAPPINQPLAQGSAVVVLFNDEVLLEKRSDNGQWAFPGGQADAKESPVECAKRELFEETGLKGLPLQFVALFDDPGSIAQYDDGNVVQTHMSVFTAILDHEPKLYISEESVDLRFWNIAALTGLDLAQSHFPIRDMLLSRFWKEKTMSANLEHDVQFEQSGNRGRFVINLGSGQEAEMTFLDRDGTFVVDHTGVPKQFEGKGIALELVKAGVEYARENGKKIRPVCPYVVMQFKRHKEWADVEA